LHRSHMVSILSQDARDQEFIDKVRYARAESEMTEGNKLLRQLSQRGPGGVQIFDNPMFATGASNTDEGYLATGAPTWMVGPMDRVNAERQLLTQEPGDFVLRESTTNGNYVLTLVASKPSGQPVVFEHHKMSVAMLPRQVTPCLRIHPRRLLRSRVVDADCLLVCQPVLTALSPPPIGMKMPPANTCSTATASVPCAVPQRRW